MSLGEELLYEIGAILLEDPDKIAVEVSPEEAEELRQLQEKVKKMAELKRKKKMSIDMKKKGDDTAMAAENDDNLK